MAFKIMGDDCGNGVNAGKTLVVTELDLAKLSACFSTACPRRNLIVHVGILLSGGKTG